MSHSVFLRKDVFGSHPVYTGGFTLFSNVFPGRFQHVQPADPVVERIKTELGFVLRFLIQLPSQFMQFLWQQAGLYVVDARLIAVSYPVVDQWVKRLHFVLMVAHLQSIPFAPG